MVISPPGAYIVSFCVLEIALSWCEGYNRYEKVFLLKLTLEILFDFFFNLFYFELFNMFMESAEVYCVNLFIGCQWSFLENGWHFCFGKTDLVLFFKDTICFPVLQRALWCPAGFLSYVCLLFWTSEYFREQLKAKFLFLKGALLYILKSYGNTWG